MSKQTAPDLHAPRPTARPSSGGPGRAIAMILLLTAAAASLLMSLDHLWGIGLPGCGEGSPCAAAAASVWGRVPWIQWPVSFVGLAYFAGLATAWAALRGPIPAALKNLVRVGAAVSVGYLLVIVVGRHYCPYCLAAHAANLVFWALVERRPAAAGSAGLAAGAVLAPFVLVTVSLFAAERQSAERARKIAEQQLVESKAAVVAAARQARQDDPAQSSGKTIPAAPASQGAAPAADGEEITASASDPKPFTGRYRIGPDPAPIRLVILSDYQCKECNRIDREADGLARARTDVSLSIKHFPMCSSCNPNVRNNMHPNACWAARAAEAAGIVGGGDGFWRMHHWLVERLGSFTDAEIAAALPELGFDPVEFKRVMQSDATLKLVQSDIADGMALGLHYTPMVFVNGLEMRGYQAPQALTRLVTELSAHPLPPRSAASDRPPAAEEKYVEDWRVQPLARIADGDPTFVRGAESPAVRITVFGDYQEPNCAELDRKLRDLLSTRGDVQYRFRLFPLNPACNPLVKITGFGGSCLAARTAVAAGHAGGPDAFWKLHEWMMDHQDALDLNSLTTAAHALGIDVDALNAAREEGRVAEYLNADITAGRAAMQRGIPMMFVNERYLPRWKHGERSLLERVIAEAARQPPAGN